MHLPEDSYGLGFRVYSAALEGSISVFSTDKEFFLSDKMRIAQRQPLSPVES